MTLTVSMVVLTMMALVMTLRWSLRRRLVPTCPQIRTDPVSLTAHTKTPLPAREMEELKEEIG